MNLTQKCKLDNDCPSTTPAGCCLYVKYSSEGTLPDVGKDEFNSYLKMLGISKVGDSTKVCIDG